MHVNSHPSSLVTDFNANAPKLEDMGHMREDLVHRFGLIFVNLPNGLTLVVILSHMTGRRFKRIEIYLWWKVLKSQIYSKIIP